MTPISRTKLFAAVFGLLGLTTPAFTAYADDTTYVNDANGRTKTVTGVGWSVVYTYDAAGNITQIVRTAPMALLGVVSRKTHGTAGTYDLPLDQTAPVTGNVTVEPRNVTGAHSIVFQFNSTITAAGTASIVDSSLAAIAGATASTSASGTEVSVALTGIPDNIRVKVTLAGVNGGGAYASSLGFLKGDVNNSRSVNSSDISSVKASSGQPATSSNFLRDLNFSGDVNSSDISIVKAQSGLSLVP